MLKWFKKFILLILSYNSLVLFCIKLVRCRINTKVCSMYLYVIILAFITILVYAAQQFANTRFKTKSLRLSGNEINSLLTKRMRVKGNTRKIIEIDRLLLRHGYSFITPINLVQTQDGCYYSFNELASNGKRITAWRLCRAIKAMKIEGIKDVKIPKPGICSIQTKKNVSFASLQKVLTLLGVYQCDIVDQHSSIKFAEN